MAFDSYNAGLAGYFATNLTLGGLPLDPKTTSCTLARDITQASTVTVTVEDVDRAVLNSQAVRQKTVITIGPISFSLVQINKTGNSLSLVFEDSVIAYLRGLTGTLAAAPGVCTRVDFAYQLCRAAGVRFIGAPSTIRALEPLSRGTSSDPNEDTWSCLVRIAQDVGYRCFSDGTSIIFGPDSWLFAAWPPVMTINEKTLWVDFIDFEWDIGKPLGAATVYTYEHSWHGDVGAIIGLQNMGIANTTWMVASIQRDLYHSPITVGLVAQQPTLPEPTTGG